MWVWGEVGLAWLGLVALKTLSEEEAKLSQSSHGPQCLLNKPMRLSCQDLKEKHTKKLSINRKPPIQLKPQTRAAKMLNIKQSGRVSVKVSYII